ncbi:MAG TPA: methyltransferase domain-containing protein [Pirellulales bacterium]|nr:methyltransferase domain-containing protein [Pirellulales bacterium]
MKEFPEIDYQAPDFGDFYDELPLWSAHFGRMLLEHVPLRPGMTILDVGAGTGFLSIELAQRCGAAATVIAVDPWQAAIDRLEHKLRYLGIANVRTRVGGIEAVDLPDAGVDLIVSNLGLNNFDQPEAALRTCFRVARPGAPLLLTTNLVGHMTEFYDAYRGVLEELGFDDQLPVLDVHIQHRATIDSVRAMLEGAGFEYVRAVRHAFRERFADGSALLRHYFVRLAFVPGWKSIAPEHARALTFDALESRLNHIATEHGGLSLTVPAACIEARKPCRTAIERSFVSYVA